MVESKNPPIDLVTPKLYARPTGILLPIASAATGLTIVFVGSQP